MRNRCWLNGRFYFVSVEQKCKEVTLANFSTFRSFVYCVWSMGACAPIDQTLRFRQGSVNCVRTFSWGAAAPQTPRDDGLNLARPSAKISPKTKRLVDGRAGAHRPNAIDKRTKNWKSDVKYWTVRLVASIQLQ